jgi:sulfate adenylyltransferase subunit 2
MVEVAQEQQTSQAVASRLQNLDLLEAQSIHILREAVAESERPVMLYSMGKDSSVMLRLAEKAFYPATLPFPLLHIDSTWEFRSMYELREHVGRTHEVIVYTNPECVRLGINPFDHGSAVHTDMWRTQGLRNALDAGRYDVAFGGARRDEERSRAKERVFSVRSAEHRWDPKSQRPELWNLYNVRRGHGESLRVFPLSNWTELDIWLYILRESIPIVPLYFAAPRPTVERDGVLLMVDDDRMPLASSDEIEERMIRFRTLGCYPLSGCIDSDAVDIPMIIREMLLATISERQGRVIDFDPSGSMEKKKLEGYF